MKNSLAFILSMVGTIIFLSWCIELERNDMHLVIILVCIAVIVVSLIGHYEKRLRTKEQYAMKLREEIDLLKSKVMQLIETNEYHLADSQIVYDTKWEPTTISEITGGGARIGLYIDKYQRQECWEKELVLLEQIVKRTKEMEKPFVLAENFNQRELVLLGQKNTTDFPIYGIENQPQLARITTCRLPFYFILNAKGVMSSVFIPDKRFKTVDSAYFASMVKQCKSSNFKKNILKKMSI